MDSEIQKVEEKPEVKVEAKPARTEAEIGAECQRFLLELGQRTYQQWLNGRGIDQINKKIYALNVEAYKLQAQKLDPSQEIVDG